MTNVLLQNKVIQVFFLLGLWVALTLSSIPIVSANGLIVNQTNYNVTKFFNQDLLYTFTLRNTDSFTFYNITIEDNNDISVPIISELGPGQGANVDAMVKSNENFNFKQYKIKGFYYSNVGVSNTTHDINVDFYNGLSRCDFSIVKGDKVNWKNNVPDVVEIRNAITNTAVTTIQQNQSYLSTFESPTTFSYVFMRRGFSFTPVCTITVLNDVGLINNPELDGILNLSLKTIFDPTSINTTILERNYTLDVFAFQDGIITIKNTGDKIAKDVKLSGKWMTFNSNNFDLEPGQTKGIVYTIRPILNNAAETNKTYLENITITGNFQTVYEQLSIFVNYANINNSNSSGNYQSLLGLLQQFCKDNPDEVFCKDKPSVVYVGNTSDEVFNVTYSQEQVKRIYEYIFSMGDDQRIVNNYMKETMLGVSNSIDEVKGISINNTRRLQDLESLRKQNDTTITVIIVFFLILVLVGVLITTIIIVRKNKNLQEIKRW